MKLLFFEDRSKIREVICGLPYKNILWEPDVVLVKHPEEDVYLVLKSRHMKNETTLKLPKESYEDYTVLRKWDDDHSDLHRKNLIIDYKLLDARGLEALDYLVRSYKSEVDKTMNKNQKIIYDWLTTSSLNFIDNIIELDGAFESIPENVQDAYSSLNYKEKLHLIHKASGEVKKST